MDAIIVRRNPTLALSLTEPDNFLEELDRYALDVWNSWTPLVYHDRRAEIPMDMHETKDDLIVKAELPGFKKEDIDVKLEGDSLTLKAVSKREELPKESTSYLSERCFGEYSRSLTLPVPVQSDKVVASFENGILELRLPKTEQVKARHIEVKAK
jgi:HSP20 family protein